MVPVASLAALPRQKSLHWRSPRDHELYTLQSLDSKRLAELSSGLEGLSNLEIIIYRAIRPVYNHFIGIFNFVTCKYSSLCNNIMPEAIEI